MEVTAIKSDPDVASDAGAPSTGESSGISAALEAEIDAAVAAEVDNAKKEDAPAGQQGADAEVGAPDSTPADDDSESEGAGDDSESEGAGNDSESSEAEEAEEAEGADAPPPGLSDEAVERAVRAGLPLSEIKQCPSEAFLAAMCARIEGSAGDVGSPGDAGSSDPGNDGDIADVDKLLSAIPDLNPNEYAEEIVAGFKSFKEIIQRQGEIAKQQSATIAALRGNQSDDWFATKAEGVKSFTKGDPEKVAAVREKFDVLKAGYKAAGKDVTGEAVFNEAAHLVLGSEMEAARLETKRKAAKRRSAQRIQRPSGNRVQAKPDVLAEVADWADRKFFS